MQTIDQLIPHRPPMQLIDRVLGYNDEQLWAQVSINLSSPFLAANQIPALVGIEYLAQASAAFFTVRATPGDKPRAGMLIASRKFTTTQPGFALDSHLLVSIKLASRLPGTQQGPALVKFAGEIFLLKAPINSALPANQMPDMTSTEAIVQADLSVYI